MTQNKQLYMVRLGLDMRSLVKTGRQMRLPLHGVDDGYLVHCQLGQLFGNDAPKPFSLGHVRRRWLDVTAYTSRDVKDLSVHADSFADPYIHSSCDWDVFAQKRMPMSWNEGSQYRFEVRICPVVRANSDSPCYKRGSEIDAYLAQCNTTAEACPDSRSAVYIHWLEEQFQRREGAQIEACRMTGFRLIRIARRAQRNGRRASVRQRPDVRVEGMLTVTDGGKFTELLRRGVGRHRAFGFGMLLLIPIG